MRGIFVIAAIVILLFAGVFYLWYWADEGQSVDYDSPEPEEVAGADSAAVENTVRSFGATLKAVSVLAPDASTTIASAYGQYLTPELLAEYVDDPEEAPGRTTSNPYPNEIEIDRIEHALGGGDRYRVRGYINEVETTNPETVVARQSVVLTLEKRGESWLISAVELGA